MANPKPIPELKLDFGNFDPLAILTGMLPGSGAVKSAQHNGALPMMKKARPLLPYHQKMDYIDPLSTGQAQPQQLNMGTAPQYGLQGQDNPGYIPLQNSGYGGQGYLHNMQPAQDPNFLNRMNRY